ncbi:putative cyclase SCIF3.09c [Hyaloraphidium curvatum]|nr:putative cyclase SCIF3.09c [Hyaloraphidium curvatum]
MPHLYSERQYTLADIDSMAEKCSNWGRWGPDDELGTLNLVTPEVVAAAAKLVKTGKTYALGLDFARNGPQQGNGERFNCIHTMLRTGADAVYGKQDAGKLRYADDIVTMPLQSGTQWDALSHVFYKDIMWNGYSATEVDSFGAHKCGIEKTKARMVGRGVLLDMARFLGKKLEPGLAFTGEDLAACAAKQGVEVRAGDFLLIRTGHKEDAPRSGDWTGYIGPSPGIGFESLPWIKEKDVAAICSDTFCVEVCPFEFADAACPLHWILLPKMGVHLGEMFDLKELADDCAADGVYEFLFTAPPIPVSKAVGSPVNPIAIK